MAKLTKAINFKNCSIDFNARTITEVTKDETKVYKLDTILKDWDGIEGVSFTLKQDDELQPDGE